MSASISMRERIATAEMVQCTDSSSEEDESEIPVLPGYTATALMWTFDTPRQYLKHVSDRHMQNKYVPADFNRMEMADTFRQALRNLKIHDDLLELIVVKEYNSRKKPESDEHVMHFHVIFHMKRPVTAREIVVQLSRLGCTGKVSYPGRRGWLGLMSHVLCTTRTKNEEKLDSTPCVWPGGSYKLMSALSDLQKRSEIIKMTESSKRRKMEVPANSNAYSSNNDLLMNAQTSHIHGCATYSSREHCQITPVKSDGNYTRPIATPARAHAL